MLIRYATLSLLLLGGCTLNVQGVTRTGISDSPAPLSSLRSDVRTIGFPYGDVEVRGADRADGHAALTLAGILRAGASPSTVDQGMAFAWDDAAGITTLAVTYRGPSPETLSLESLTIEVPRACEIDLESADLTLTVLDVAAPVHARTVSGAIVVRGATTADLGSTSGDIDITADTATIEGGSGTVTLDLRGLADVTTTLGRIRGSIREGGTIVTSRGSIVVDLVGTPTTELDLTTADGLLELRVAADASLDLELSTVGPIHVAVGTVTTDTTGALTRRLGAGGPRVVLRSDRGSVRVVEL